MALNEDAFQTIVRQGKISTPVLAILDDNAVQILVTPDGHVLNAAAMLDDDADEAVASTALGNAYDAAVTLKQRCR